VIESGSGRDLSGLVVSRAGGLVATGDEREPYRLIDPAGLVVEPVSIFLRELQAMGRSAATLRSYGMDLLRWWRFLDAVGVAWDRASRVEARDFSCWIGLTVKQRLQTSRPRAARWSSGVLGAPNPVTGKPGAGDGYAPASIAHSETVLRRFYDFCAMRRSVISPAQRGEMGGTSLDPMAYPASKGNTGDESMPGN
jgi:hypothetical protein